jgi:hypothetical protein
VATTHMLQTTSRAYHTNTYYIYYTLYMLYIIYALLRWFACGISWRPRRCRRPQLGGGAAAAVDDLYC